MKKMLMIFRTEVPVARRMPISFDFCRTLTTSTEAMPSATARITKNWIITLELLWDFSATKSWRLIFIQLSASRPVAEAIRSAISAASNTSPTVTSTVEMRFGRSSRVCAARIETKTQR